MIIIGTGQLSDVPTPEQMASWSITSGLWMSFVKFVEQYTDDNKQFGVYNNNGLIVFQIYGFSDGIVHFSSGWRWEHDVAPRI